MYKVSKLAAGSVIAATAAVAGASVALADVYEPRKVVYERPLDWSGVYFGVGSGYQWSSIDVHGPAAPFGIGITSDHNEAFVAAHLGAQHQFGAIVLGVEGGWLSTFRADHGSHEFCDSVPPVLTRPILAPGDFCTARLQDIFTIGGRAGYAAGKWMPYVTGGYANGAFDFENRIPTVSPGGTQLQEEAHKRLGGWYIGGGLEWAISPGWSTGIEYRHYEFDSGTTTAFCASTGGASGCAPLGSPLERVKFEATTDTVEARVSWRWGRPEAAPLK
jgi:opacity protein-like surface antigen